MGLVSKNINIKINARNHKYYENLGYKIPKYDKHGTTIVVSVDDLSKYCTSTVECQCDNCGKFYKIHYSDYRRRNHDGKTYCNSCAHKVFHSGENNIHWNPNLTDEDREIGRNILGYTDFIKKVLKRDNYSCQCCNKTGKKLEVHHMDGYDLHKDKRLDFSNAITLCKDCHKNFHDTYGRGKNNKQQFEEWMGKTIDYLSEYDGELPPPRQIICIDDNIIFTNAKEAADYIDSSPSSILKCCLRQDSARYGASTKSVHGKHFLYLDDYSNMSQDEMDNYLKWCNELKTYKNSNNSHPNSKSVVCVNTKTVFKSGRYASQIMKVSNGGLSECCSHRKNHCGLLPNGEKIQWMYLSEYEKLYDTSDLKYYE